MFGSHMVHSVCAFVNVWVCMYVFMCIQMRSVCCVCSVCNVYSICGMSSCVYIGEFGVAVVFV